MYLKYTQGPRNSSSIFCPTVIAVIFQLHTFSVKCFLILSYYLITLHQIALRMKFSVGTEYQIWPMCFCISTCRSSGTSTSNIKKKKENIAYSLQAANT